MIRMENLLGLVCLSIGLTTPAFAAVPQTSPGDESQPAPEAKDAPTLSDDKVKDRSGIFSIPGLSEETLLDPSQPLRPRTVEDRRRLRVMQAFAAARAMEDQRRWDRAITLYEEALGLRPESVPILKSLSQLSFRTGEVEQGIAYAEQTLAIDPNDSVSLRRLASLYPRLQRFDDLERLLERVLANPKLDKNQANALLAHNELGKIYAVQQDDDAAGRAAEQFAVVLNGLDRPEALSLTRSEVTRILGTNPGDSYRLYGLVFLQASRFDLAIEAFERSLIYEPDEPRVALLMIQALLAADRARDALERLDVYLDRPDAQAEGYILLGQALRALDRGDEVLPQLEAALEDNPKNFGLRLSLLEIYQREELEPKAIELFESLLESDLSTDEIQLLGLNQAANRRTDEVLTLLSQTLARGDRNQLQAIQSTLAAVLSQPEFAREVFEEGLKRYRAEPPDLDEGGRQLLINLALRLDRTEVPLELTRLALDRAENPNPRIYLETFEALSNFEKHAEAAETLNEYLEKYPDQRSRTLFTFLAYSYENAGQSEDALEAARDALDPFPPQFDPFGLDALRIACSVLLEQEKDEEGVQLARQALETDPENVDLNQYVGYLLDQAGRDEECEQFYRNVLNRFGDNDEQVKVARLGLSILYVDRGRIDEGVAELEALYERLPDDPNVNNDLGYLYADQGIQLERAEEMIRKAVAAEPENAAYLDSLGWVLYKRGRYAEAVEPLTQAVEQLNRDDPTIYDHLGDAYFELKQYDEARSYWQKAIEASQVRGRSDQQRLPEIRRKLDDLDLQLEGRPKPASESNP